MARNVDSGRGIAKSGYFGGILTQKTNLSPFSLNLILFVLATYLRQVAVFGDSVGADALVALDVEQGEVGLAPGAADPAGRTIRFVLNFNFDKVQEAEVKWNRLAVYAVSFRDLLDRQH